MTTYTDIWKRLSSINLSKSLQKKGGLSFLPWTAALKILMENYPNAQWIPSKEFLPDGSCLFRQDMDIDGCQRHVILAVMNYKNEAILNPNARDINDSYWRTFVKVLAVFGLGHYVYAGEDVPFGAVSGQSEEEPEEEVFDLPAKSEVKAKPPAPPAKTKAAPKGKSSFSFDVARAINGLDKKGEKDGLASDSQLWKLSYSLKNIGAKSSPAFDLLESGDRPPSGQVSNEIEAAMKEKEGGVTGDVTQESRVDKRMNEIISQDETEKLSADVDNLPF
jgi:hypothetical protein